MVNKQSQPTTDLIVLVINDTSGSLNFPTPISIKDITKEFTANIHERCTVRKVHMQTISNQSAGCPVTSPSALLLPATVENEKKPSYLNLACCVNGYSNLTTYDSKIRQDINKSREVSPIRPSSNSIQYCKKNDCLAPPPPSSSSQLPPLQNISNGSMNGSSQTTTTTITTSKLAYCQENGHQTTVTIDDGGNQRSFIQQRVERLYGPGALAQGFISQKKVRDNFRTTSAAAADGGSLDQEITSTEIETSELTMKFKQLSPSKDYGEFRRKINGTESQTLRAAAMENNVDNNSIDLPVLRHLSQEFRAQLPKISPKRNIIRSPTPMEKMTYPDALKNTKDTFIQKLDERTDEVDHKNVTHNTSISNTDMNNVTLSPEFVHKNSVEIIHHIEMTPTPTQTPPPAVAATAADADASEPSSSHIVPSESQNVENIEKNGHYFLKLLKKEQDRLLILASEAEKYIELLTVQPDISEEVFGLLRAASGKARLLVSQKMKQFEGLCHKNLNDIPGVKFPTTTDDLQGFWDMVNLQIDHIDSIFADLENLKSNNWKKQEEIAPSAAATPRKQKSNSRTLIPKPNSVSNGNSTKSQAAMSAAALKRESQRKQLMEMKRKNKMAMASAGGGGGGAGAGAEIGAGDGHNIKNLTINSEGDSIEIFINEKNQS